jgi:hypothetical protein
MALSVRLAMTLPIVVARHDSAEAIPSMARDCFASLAMTRVKGLAMTKERGLRVAWLFPLFVSKATIVACET